jgi:hypothetical protein
MAQHFHHLFRLIVHTISREGFCPFAVVGGILKTGHNLLGCVALEFTNQGSDAGCVAFGGMEGEATRPHNAKTLNKYED